MTRQETYFLTWCIYCVCICLFATVYTASTRIVRCSPCLTHVLVFALHDVSLLLSPSLSGPPHRREVSRCPLLILLVVPLTAFYPPRLVYFSTKLSISHLRKLNSATKPQAFQPLARNYRLRAAVVPARSTALHLWAIKTTKR